MGLPAIPPVGRAASDPDTRAPDGSEIRVLVTAVQGSSRASLCEVRLPAGGTSRPVAHRSVEEIWYVVEGRGEVWRCPPGGEGTAVAVQAGDALVIPTRWRFQFRATPGSGLRFLCYTVPPWPGPDEAEPAGPGGLGPPTV
jgi:mannose-6-phosphate isomerase-like protein (cupin superfamily)